MSDRLTLSVIIGTRNRPESLQRCLESLCEQTTPPDEVLIVDDGALDPEAALAPLRRRGIETRYYNKSHDPGLTKSRNLGIRESTGSVLLFLDDDVVLSPGYVKAILATYESQPQAGGVCGRLVGRDLGFGKRLFLRIFLLDGTRDGSVLPNGVGVLVRHITRVTPVAWFSGCNMSFRREVFSDLLFDEAFTGNGWGDDRDFSFRVGLRYPLLACPDATLVHVEDPVSRANPFRFGEMEIVFVHRFFQKHIPQRPPNLAALWWSFAGISLKNLATWHWRRLGGNLKGMTAVLLRGSMTVEGGQ